MEYIILIVFLFLTLVVLKIVFQINFKQIEKIGKNDKLDKIASHYPSNVEICKKILKKLNNENVLIEEEKDATNCLYIVATNKILIGNLRNSFTRIQTIAHECLHSVQNKTILMFNFIYSNIYLLAFIILAVLSIIGRLPYKMLFINIFILMGFIFYFIRSYLEMDAMTKARFLAKEYIEQENISTEDEKKDLIKEYDNLNNLGIKATNYSLFMQVIIKTIILVSIIMIRGIIC